MITEFHKYADILRKFGNFRFTYVIFCLTNDHSFEVFSENDIARISVDDLETVTDIDKPITVVNVTAEQIKERPEILCYANEVIADTDISSILTNDFAQADRTLFSITYIKRVIRYEDAIVFKAPKDFPVGDIAMQPYHLLILDVRQKIAMAVIWDTREIVAIEENLGDDRIAEIMAFKHANDSSKLLYLWNYVPVSNECRNYLEKNYIIDNIISY